jgi:tetratricopeptide (TPR) repeat protein
MCLHFAGTTLLRLGERLEAERLWEELAELSQRTRDETVGNYEAEEQIVLSFLAGRLEEVTALWQRLDEAMRRGTGSSAPGQGLTSDRLFEYLGLPLRSLPEDFAAPVRPIAAIRGLLLARLGRHEEARTVFQQFTNIASEDDESSISIITNAFEAALIVRIRKPSAVYFQGYCRWRPILISALATCSARVSGGSLVKHSICWATPPERGISTFRDWRWPGAYSSGLRSPSYASTWRSCLEHYPDEREAAIEHLDFAIAEFQAMKMQPALERALRHRGLLKA